MSNVRKFKRHSYRGFVKLILLCAILLGLYFLIFELFRVNQIVVTGSDRYTEEEIKDYLMTEKLDQNSLYLLVKYKYREHPVIPFVEDISIKLLDRNTVQVTLYEKVVTGCVEYMGEYMYFDKDGIVVESTREREDSIPLIVGLRFNRIALNEQIQIQKQSLFETILNLTKLINQYEIAVSEITFDSDYEVTLTCGDSVVLLGKHDFYDFQLSQLNNILESANGVAYTYHFENYTSIDKEFHANKIK